MSETYQGWANRETWLAHLWLANEEGLYREARRRVRAAVREETPIEDAAREVWETVADPHGGFIGDVLGAFALRVDWGEVAEAFRDE